MSALLRVAVSLFLSLIVPVFAPLPAESGPLREQAVVGTVILNRAGTSYDSELTEKVSTWLDQKLQGIYRRVPIRPETASPAAEESFWMTAGAARADYLLVLELQPMVTRQHVALFRYGKGAVAPMSVRIYNVPDRKTLYAGEFGERAKKDEQAVFLDERLIALFTVRSKDIALQAMDNTLYRAGEVISIHLPLEPVRHDRKPE